MVRIDFNIKYLSNFFWFKVGRKDIKISKLFIFFLNLKNVIKSIMYIKIDFYISDIFGLKLVELWNDEWVECLFN